ncbi:MAG TPA: hypothetical protein VMX17_16755 [Candidatus Glassbacteria bacterium]|nr:hypothetical protein [Candidatus Glassbacteria bacterium]
MKANYYKRQGTLIAAKHAIITFIDNTEKKRVPEEYCLLFFAVNEAIKSGNTWSEIEGFIDRLLTIKEVKGEVK